MRSRETLLRPPDQVEGRQPCTCWASEWASPPPLRSWTNRHGGRRLLTALPPPASGAHHRPRGPRPPWCLQGGTTSPLRGSKHLAVTQAGGKLTATPQRPVGSSCPRPRHPQRGHPAGSRMAGAGRKLLTMVPSCSRGGVEWTCARGTGSRRAGPVRPLSSSGVKTDIADREGSPTPRSGSQDGSAPEVPRLRRTESSRK